MRKPFFALLILGLTLNASAQEWVGYTTYAPRSVAVAGVLGGANLAWLNDVGRLLRPEAFTFLGRRDADHWMALTNKGGSWLLQIHDETARFNFRAAVAPASGRLTVEKGVDWAGQGPEADAKKAAQMAADYLTKARTASGLFGAAETHTAMAADSHTTVASDTHTIMAADAHGTSASDAHGTAAADASGMAAADAHAAAGHTTAAVSAEGTGGQDLWQKLVDGNLRFVSGKVKHPDQSMARIEETAKGQHPFAIVVTCSDSRVPPELLFDQGFGDLFVVRTAGEVVTAVELGSIEYAVEHLGATYLVVMGHERCGAVDATVKGGDLPPNIEAIAAQIRPAVETARFLKGDVLDNSIRENAKLVLKKILGSDIVAEAVKAGHLNYQAAYYDLDTAKVAALP